MDSLQGGLGGAIEERDLTDLMPGKWKSGGKKRHPEFWKISGWTPKTEHQVRQVRQVVHFSSRRL